MVFANGFTTRARIHQGLCRGVSTIVLSLASASGALGDSWRSTLYPADWTPPGDRAFASDKLIQDFSYAGYRRGEAPIPQDMGPVFDVVSYGADPTGVADSTLAIQNAIYAAEAAGGGVVNLPAGTFSVSLLSGTTEVLRVRGSGVVIRGAGSGNTRLVNTSTDMRGHAIVRFLPVGHSFGTPVSVAQDLTTPTTRIPVANASEFAQGDFVQMEWDFTDEWIQEHGQTEWWNEIDGVPAAARYQREVMAVNTSENWIEVDVPTRYTMKTRDNARVMKLNGRMHDSGIEGISIGNVQHEGTGFGEEDYNTPGTAAYDVHSSFVIDFQRCFDSWATNVKSFQPEGNTSTAHMLSNGIRFYKSFRMTAQDCVMERPQYGGGGGNGYMYRATLVNDSLIQDCLAEFSRHGFVVSHAGTSGNVFQHCEDRISNHATGDTGSYTTGGGDGSDNHMHFSHSNLWDDCHAEDSFWEAIHRGHTDNHGLTTAHGVYWNTSGSGAQYPTKLVVTEQGDYGYVIGTSGSVDTVVNLNPASHNTGSWDHVEGEGLGEWLFPRSLYEDQLRLRLGTGVAVTSFTSAEPGSTLSLDVFFDVDGRASTTSSEVDVSGRVENDGAAGGILEITFDAMKSVSTDLATLGDKLVDGSIECDSAGRMGVYDDPGGAGMSVDGSNREGMQILLDASDILDPTANVQIDTINASWVNSGESFTVVNLLTREFLEFDGSGDTYPHFDFDVSGLGLSVQGGESDAIAAIIAGDNSSFRIRGFDFSISTIISEADFDEDGDVDGDDLMLWKRGLGITSYATHRQGDADADGDVDVGDLLMWQRQFDGTAGAPSSVSVPEPASMLLVLCGLVGLMAQSSRAS